MHSDWFDGIDVLQSRWQHGENVGYCYPSGLEKTLCKWDIYVPLVTKGLIEVNAGKVASSWFGDISDVGFLHLKVGITSGFRNEENHDHHNDVTHPTVIATLQPQCQQKPQESSMKT